MKTFQVLGKAKNEEHSNTTELNAMNSIVKGYWEHPDWMAHLFRYGYAAKMMEKAKPEYVLDIGCGRLNLAHYLWRNRYTYPTDLYRGIDLLATEEWLKYVTEPYFDINLIRGNILEWLDLTPAPFVVCFETFEHVGREYQQQFLDYLYRMTLPRGTCLMSSPNAGITKTTAENHLGPDGVSRERTFEEKTEMCRAAGFDVQRTFGTFTAVTRLHESVAMNPDIATMKEYLPYPAFCAIAAASHPELANNAVYQLVRVP
jgi:2-polyprenyl-3-methyl-5-hydroxy-6-metoxy-1,4-benzoquinol methylase